MPASFTINKRFKIQRAKDVIANGLTHGTNTRENRTASDSFVSRFSHVKNFKLENLGNVSSNLLQLYHSPLKISLVTLIAYSWKLLFCLESCENTNLNL